MARIKTGQSGDFPCYFAFLFDPHNIGDSPHLVQIPPADRLESPDRMLASHQVAVMHPRKNICSSAASRPHG
jgi:hypothetical protein